ncbi:hypothetical protein G3I40_30430 [Streptomyces sp. SID14478]|uniref:hypothetical protein n=1 Tax=Streptomyces sp. SID14478 TaxID=2706073 RepID=UPI0013D92583|nr:hypothetical protein [Streptomyces sp. SID14478]NEB79502.1 hypothetical protein [Streptomyces sp. SID14478]
MSTHVSPARRRTGQVCAAAVCAATVLTSTVGMAAAAPTASVVHPSDLGPKGPWIRLQDDPSNSSKTPGTQAVSPKVAPDSYNGSLHLAVRNGQQSQAARYFPAKKPLQGLVSKGISYRSFVDASASNTTGYGPNLQFPTTCKGVFTTLSFEPGAANDDTGHHGVKPNTWQRFKVTGSAQLRTSRAIPGVAAASQDLPMSDFAAACTDAGDGALGVIANVGVLGSPSATLDTYVDDITVDGTRYDFAVTGKARAQLTVTHTLTAGAKAGSGRSTFTNPATGPAYPGTGSVLTFKGPKTLKAQHLRVTAYGRTVHLTRRADGTLIGSIVNTRRAGANLAPSGTGGGAFTVSAVKGAPAGRVRVGTELTLTGAAGKPVATGIRAAAATQIVTPKPKPKPKPPRPIGPVDTGIGGAAPLPGLAGR